MIPAGVVDKLTELTVAGEALTKTVALGTGMERAAPLTQLHLLPRAAGEDVVALEERVLVSLCSLHASVEVISAGDRFFCC